MVRRALVLLLVLVLAVAPVASGCSGGDSGPTDNSGANDSVPVGPGPTGPGPSEPGPTEPGAPTGPEFPQGQFGVVFDDANANGIRDAGEPGLTDVLVSNGIACRPTDSDGVYNLPSDSSLVFVTVPGDRDGTGPWYSGPSSDNVDFGLKPDPGKGQTAGSGFTFVQMTDLHAGQEQAAALAGLAAELNSLSPAFVVATGDLIVDGNDATPATAGGWFDVYQGFTSVLTMPVYQALGNHDVVGIHRADADTSGPGYGKGTFTGRFGPSYYSFDWGRYHCLVLDPNDMENGQEVYRLSAAQMRWLADDLRFREGAPLLVFYHEPTASWTNRDDFLRLLEGRCASLFCGHLHQSVTLDSAAGPGGSGEVSEQVTAAVSGEWWRGPNPDGRPQGNRLVSVAGDGVDSLYIGTGDTRTVDFGLSPVVSGPVDLAIKLLSRSGPGGTSAGTTEEVTAGATGGVSAVTTGGVSAVTTGGASAGITSVTCLVDDDQTQTLALSLEDRGPWAVASASWDPAGLAEGYHHLTLRATDAAGSFEERFDFKVSRAGTVTPSDLTTHREVFWGSYVSVEAQFGLMLAGPLSLGDIDVPAGMGFILLRDSSDVLPVVAGEVFSPPLPTTFLSAGTTVIVKLVLVRVTMAQIMSSREWDAYYPLVSRLPGYIPDSAREPPGVGSITDLTAVWGGRLLSAADFTVKPGPA